MEKSKNEYETVAIELSIALSLIRNKMVDFHRGYFLLKERNGSDAEVRELVEKEFSNWREVLSATDELKEDVNKIMTGKAL